MIKKTVTALITAVVLTVLGSATAPPAQAQIVYCTACCDSFGNIRCTGGLVACGYSCFCAGQGYGVAC
jgi:hypothetical protein